MRAGVDLARPQTPQCPTCPWRCSLTWPRGLVSVPIVSASSETVWLRGLDWLEAHREGFALPSGMPPELFRLKGLGELAAIAEVIARRADLPEAGRARALLSYAWQALREGEALAEFLEDRPYPVLGTTYSVFERAGWRHERTRQRLAQLGQPGAMRAAATGGPRAGGMQLPALYGTDGVAVLCLGLALAWEVLGLPSPWQRARLFPHTRLAQAPALEELTVPDAYSLTHVVFFMTDWGAEPDGLPANARAHVEASAPRWMAAFRARSNFDLYAELAATLCCIGVAPPAEAEDVLRAAQQDDGAVPGPAERVAERTRGIEDPERRRFVSAYHTTLAATLASFGAGPGLARRTPAAAQERP